MSEENVEKIRRGYEAYERGDLDAAVADLAPACKYIAAGTVPGLFGQGFVDKAGALEAAGLRE